MILPYVLGHLPLYLKKASHSSKYHRNSHSTPSYSLKKLLLMTFESICLVAPILGALLPPELNAIA